MIRIRRGLDLPIDGAPAQGIAPAPPVRRVALVGDDFVGLRPRLQVRVGDAVRLGQLLFEDKNGVRFTSPGAGEVEAVHRGEKRRMLSVVVRLDGDGEETFSFKDVRAQLVASGLWTALRARPFGRIPAPDAPAPHSLFVTAIDTEPLAPDPAVVLRGNEDDFVLGLRALTELTEGPVRLCTAPGAAIPGADVAGVERHEFAGPHPAGLPGTHIHFLDAVGARKSVWHTGYGDVVAIGRLRRAGRVDVVRVAALAGPMVERPRLVRTRLGASVEDLLAGELRAGPHRAISGSVLSGRTAAAATAFLGRYDVQVSVLSDRRPRPLFGWLGAGRDRFSSLPLFAPGRKTFNTSLHGEPRAIVPIGAYDRVMPLDILPVPLLKALVIGDVENAIDLGCLELVEEDLALCSFVCPGKNDFRASLRDVLTQIEREG